MSDDHAQLYDEVCRHARRTSLLGSISELLEWDQRTKMPPADAVLLLPRVGGVNDPAGRLTLPLSIDGNTGDLRPAF